MYLAIEYATLGVIRLYFSKSEHVRTEAPWLDVE
jgi:hypothetical protein